MSDASITSVTDENFFHALIPNRIIYLLVPAVMHLLLLTGYAIFVEDPINWGIYADGVTHGYGTIRFTLAAVTALFLAYVHTRRRLTLSRKTEKWALRSFAVLYFIGTTVETMVDVSNGGTPAMFSFTVLAAAMIFYEPMRLVLPLFSLGAAAVALAGVLWGSPEYSFTILYVQPVVAAVWGWGIYAVTITNRYRMWITQQELSKKKHELEESKERLNDAVRLKDTVLAAVGHDLRAPIAQIKNLLRILDGSGDRYELKRHLLRRELHQTMRNAERTTDNLLALRGAPTSGEGEIVEPVSLTDVCAETENIMSPVAEAKGVKLSFSADEDVLVVGNRNMLITVLRNLIDNGIKYTASGDGVDVRCLVERDLVRIEVADSGTGLAPGVLEAIDRGEWGRSIRGTAGETGLGLGLSVCRTFLHAQDSELRLRPGAFGGTVAGFRLPRFRRTPRPSPAPEFLEAEAFG